MYASLGCRFGKAVPTMHLVPTQATPQPGFPFGLGHSLGMCRPGLKRKLSHGEEGTGRGRSPPERPRHHPQGPSAHPALVRPAVPWSWKAPWVLSSGCSSSSSREDQALRVASVIANCSATPGGGGGRRGSKIGLGEPMGGKGALYPYMGLSTQVRKDAT